jgi:ribosomal protein L11 methyltransferase
VEVRVSGVAAGAHDAVVTALVDAGAPGVQELSRELVTHVTAATDLAALAVAIESASPGAAVQCTRVGEIDWAARWPIQVRAQRVGRIAVAPPWLADTIDDVEIPIVIEPAMAFGTGEHETTRGVLHLMQQVIRPGERVADLGTGSAVLAIAAAKLGAARVMAIELDPDAIGNAEENVAANGVTDRVTVIEGDAAILLPLVSPVRVILANIISSVLLVLAPVMRDALAHDGRVILSGILTAERAAMLAALGDAGWRLESDCTEGEWWSGVIARR